MLFRKLFLLFLVTIIIVVETSAQEIDRDKLTVYGKVRVFAKMDRAIVSFKIEGVGRTLKDAFSDANKKIDSISVKLFAIGLSQNNLSTSFFKNRENIGNKAFLSSKRDYKTTMSVAITTDSLDLLENIVVILSESNIEEISDISFEMVDYSELRLNAIKQATAKAIEKAKVISEQLEVQLGNAFEVEEIKQEDTEKTISAYRRYSHTPFNSPYLLVQDFSEMNSGLYAEEIQFDAEVKVVFNISESNDSKSTD